MKKGAAVLALVCLLALSAVFSAASAETLGFGFVNNTDVALRRGIGGKAIVRLPRDTCVWIKDAKTDGSGVLWYEVNAGLHIDYSNADYTGWMKAEFIDAGDAVWSGAQSLSVSGTGMIVLKKDGTVAAAGTGIHTRDDGGWTEFRNWVNGLSGIRQAGFCTLGLEYYALDGDGVYQSNSTPYGILGKYRLRLVGGDDWVYGISTDGRLLRGEEEVDCGWTYPRKPGPEDLARVTDIQDNGCRCIFLMDDGTLFVQEDESGDTEADWASWTDIASLDASACMFTPGARKYRAAYAAVRKDGTVLAAPEELAEVIGNWTGMKKVAVGDRWVLGLKEDGTVLSAGLAGETPPDLSGWTEIVDLGTGYDYCAGVRADGSVVFYGDYIFMKEGHNRK